MVEKIVGHIIDCQIDSGRIKQDEIGVYQYGYTLILERGINIAIVIILCLIIMVIIILVVMISTL